jgi:Flp pilus assembly protein TadB
MPRSASIRASDADRDRVADRLHRAAVEGRIEPDELEERLHAALRARTYGDLRRLVADLPGDRTPRRRRSPAVTALVVAIRLALVLIAVVAVITVAVVMAAWWLLWILLWMTMRGRRYGWARPRSKLDPTSMGFFTMPNRRSHAAHFCRTSSRSWP